MYLQRCDDDGKIREIDYQIYNMWFDEFINDFDQFNYIYILKRIVM